MLMFCVQVNQFLREKYFEILVSILNRGELDLAQMMFEKEDVSNKKLLANKKALASACQKFFHNVLAFGISTMGLKGIEPFKREFVCKAITIGYFRVPTFRQVFLDQLVNKGGSLRNTANNAD